MTTSIGVSREKDRQVETWIGWLEAVQRIDLQLAASALPWFTQAVASLADTTSGLVDDASNALLTVAFGWSPCTAVRAFRWLMDKHAINYEEAVAALLRGAIRHPDAHAEVVLTVLVHLLLPVATQRHSGLCTEILSLLHKRSGALAAIEAARAVLAKIQVAALPSTRADWRKEVATALKSLSLDPASAGVASGELEPERPDSESTADDISVRLPDGTVLEGEELQARLATPDGLRLVLENSPEHALYRWLPHVRRIASVLTLDAVLTLVTSPTSALARLNRPWR
jgi:hypothetical protein